MIKTDLLRIGQHVLVGSIYPTFAVPKHLARIVSVFDGSILCKSVPEQVDPDEYEEKEIEGIQITAEMLDKNGFKLSKLRASRWYKEDPKSKDRVTIDLEDGTISAMGRDHVQRTGVRFLHQLESVFADAEIDFKFINY